MRRNIAISLVAAMVIAVLIVGGCAPAPTPPVNDTTPEPPREVINWRFQAHHPPGFMTTAHLFPAFIERVDKMSGGRLKIEMYYGGDLVAPTEVDGALKEGAIQMADLGLDLFRGTHPTGWLAPNSLPPLIWRNEIEFFDLFHTQGLDELMRDGFREVGIHPLNHRSVGETYFWSAEPRYGVEDIEGFKVRFFGAMSDTMTALGGSSVFLPHEETYMAISTGTLDGSGTAWWIFRDLKLYEVCPYFIGPPWQAPQGMVTMLSLDAWEALPDDIKAIVDTADMALVHDYHQRVSLEMLYMFEQSFPEWGVTYIEWGPEDVATVTEVSVQILDDIRTEIGPQDARVSQGIDIILDFMREKGYL